MVTRVWKRKKTRRRCNVAGAIGCGCLMDERYREK